MIRRCCVTLLVNNGSPLNYYYFDFSGEYVGKLPETGVLCKETYGRLRDMLKRILQDLKKLGYQLGFDPLLEQNADKMISFITQIQDDFRLGEK